MAILRNYLFWFSVRLGTVSVGIVSTVQFSILLMISVITVENKADVVHLMEELADSINIDNKLYDKLTEDPRGLLIFLAVFFSLAIISCILLLYGAFTFEHRFLYPFLVLKLFYIILLTLLLVGAMLIFKKREYGVGILILYSNAGALIIMCLIYNWICVLSLQQMITELRTELLQDHTLENERGKEKPVIDVRYPYSVD